MKIKKNIMLNKILIEHKIAIFEEYKMVIINKVAKMN